MNNQNKKSHFNSRKCYEYFAADFLRGNLPQTKKRKLKKISRKVDFTVLSGMRLDKYYNSEK